MDHAELVKRAVTGLKRLGPFHYESGDDPHSLDCTLAGRVSRVFCVGLTRAIEICRFSGQDPNHNETAERKAFEEALAAEEENKPDEYFEDDDGEPVGSCDECESNIYAEEEDGSGLCDQCQWKASQS